MPRSQVAAIAALLVAYGAFYLCRANVDAAMPLLVEEGYGTKTQLGEMASIATLVYAIGKVVTGLLGDVIGGRRLLLLAIVGSVACSFGFGTSHALVAFVVLAAANRFFQSGGWPGLVQVVSQRFDASRYGLVMGVLSTSYELGNVCALSLCGLVVRWGWRAMFIVNPIALALIGGGAVLSLRASSPGAGPSNMPEARPRVRFAAVLPKLARSAAFWTTLGLSALLTFIRVAFLTWTPTYLYEVSRASGRARSAEAIVLSALFPAAGVVGTLFVGPLSDRLGAGRRAPVISASLAAVVALVIVLGHGPVQSPLGAALLIGGIGLFLLGPYSLLAGAIALDVAGSEGSATAAGIIDAVGYGASAASGYLLGQTADRAGWSATFDLIAWAALAATMLSAAWAWGTSRRMAR